MAPRDPQPASRLLHVCPDAAVAARVQETAERAGLAYRRFPDAFAAALELLTRPQPGTLLLLSLDGLARMEFALARWAAVRWPGLAIWAHGSRDRLNGETADAGLRLVELGQIARLLHEPLGGELVAESPGSERPVESMGQERGVEPAPRGEPPAKAPSPSPEIPPAEPRPAVLRVRVEKAPEQAPFGPGAPALVRPGPSVPGEPGREKPVPLRAAWRPAPADPLDGPSEPEGISAPEATPAAEAAPEPEAPPEPAPRDGGTLRLHRPAPDSLGQPIVSAEELAALLDPTEGDDGVA